MPSLISTYAFDKWKVTRSGAEIGFTKLQKIEIDETPEASDSEDEFLEEGVRRCFGRRRLGLEGAVSDILQERIREIERCFPASAYLSVILLAGSTLEGLLLGLAVKYPKQFNFSKSTPKDSRWKSKTVP